MFYKNRNLTITLHFLIYISKKKNVFYWLNVTLSCFLTSRRSSVSPQWFVQKYVSSLEMLCSAFTAAHLQKLLVNLTSIHGNALTLLPPCLTDDALCFGSWAVCFLLCGFLFSSFWSWFHLSKDIFSGQVHISTVLTVRKLLERTVPKKPQYF